MTSTRKLSLTAGILYLLTFVSIPTLSLYKNVKSVGYVTGAGPDTAAITGGLLEVIVALACIGTAVALYPVLKKQSQSLAAGLVAVRTLEATAIIVGVSFLLTIVSLRRNGAGADAESISKTLVYLYDRLFHLSQSFLPAINDFILGYLFYKSRLMPKWLAMLGMFAAFPLLLSFVTVLFGGIEQRSSLAGLAALPVALFELLLGLRLAFKGFKN